MEDVTFFYTRQRNVFLLVDKMIVAAELPHFRIFGAACLLASFMFGIPVSRMQDALPKLSECKWVFLRGFMSVVATLLLFLAALLGTPLGDIGALMSANGVFAAFLGRVFLHEPVQKRHFLSVFFSLFAFSFRKIPRSIVCRRPFALFAFLLCRESFPVFNVAT